MSKASSTRSSRVPCAKASATTSTSSPASDEQGVEYEVVKGPLRKGKRDDLDQLSGQRAYPVIEFDDGRTYREESSEMAKRIRAGELFADG